MTEISRRGMATAVVGGAAALGAAALLRREGSRPGVTRGRGEPTSFGSVALLASSRLALAPARAVAHRHAVPDRPSPSAVHGAWTDAVLADVEVHNGSGAPVGLSPGQFRVRVDGGPSVTLYSASREAGPVAPGETARLQIRYLAPPASQAVSLVFDDTGAAHEVVLGRLADERRAS